MRAGSHAVRDSSDAPSDSWLLVYLRRVELDYDDHDDLDGEAKRQRDYMHELQSCKYGGTTPESLKKHELTTSRTPKRESIAKEWKNREQEYKSQAWSTPYQPASFTIN